LIQFYLKELSWLFIYLFISFLLLIFIAVIKLNSLIYFSIWISINLTKRKLFVLNTFDILNISTSLITFYVFFFVFPLLIYVLYNFCITSWYKIQKKYFKSIVQKICLLNLLNLIFLNPLILILISIFFLIWHYKANLSSQILFEIQLNILDQTYLWLNVNYKVCFVIIVLYLSLIYCHLLWNFMKFYEICKYYKIYIVYFLSSFFYLMLTDLYILLLLIIINLLIIEFLFLCLCYKFILIF
jgi:hypothetical protein